MKEKRTCTKCCLTKSSKEFAFRNKEKGTRHSYCLACGRLFAKGHYAQNVRYYVIKARSRREERLNEYTDRLFDYLAVHPCIDCGEDDPIVLEFDHVRGKKAYNVSVMARLMLSWKTILKEIAKCEVRCANCHRRKTAERSGSYRYRRLKGPLAQSG
jgi:hypothetical protein